MYLSKVILLIELCSFALFFPVHSARAADSEQPVLAVIGTRETEAASDLLLAGLSGRSFASFVEREQVDRILAEQSLSLFSNTDVLQLAQLIAADGLLLLTHSDDSASKSYRARLVAARPGVVLDDFILPWPVEDSRDWVNHVETRLAPLLPKFKHLEREAVPVSILNIRSALTSEAAQRTERALSLLLVSRLAVEPNLLILERRRMDLLREEKEIAFDDTAFWAGSYLIDGVFDTGAWSPTELRVSVRLIPPNGREPIPIVASGPRDDLPKVIESLADAILAALDQTDSRTAWDPLTEAARYLDEGIWALRWEMVPEARQAAEAAWALGAHNGDAAALRACAYLPAAARPFAAFSTKRRGYRAHDIPSHFLMKHSQSWEEHPTRETLQDVLRALRDYWQYSQVASHEELLPESRFYIAGTDLLRGASIVLMYFHDGKRDGGTELFEVRALCRQIAEHLFKIPAVRETYIPSYGNRDDFNHQFTYEPNIYKIMATWGRFWQEGPEEGVQLWRRLMAFDVFPRVRDNLLRSTGRIPVVPAWARRDAARVSSMTEAFVQELLQSDDPLVRIEGHILATAVAIWNVPIDLNRLTSTDVIRYEEYSEQVIGPAFDALFDEIVAQREAIVRSPSDRSIRHAVDTLWSLNAGVVTETTERIDVRIRDLGTFWRELDNEWRDHSGRMAKQIRDEALFAKQIRILEEGVPISRQAFMETFGASTTTITEEQAKLLLARLDTYQANIESVVIESEDNESKSLQDLLEYISLIKPRIQLKASGRIEPKRSGPPVRRPMEPEIPLDILPESSPLVLKSPVQLPVELLGLIPGGETYSITRKLEEDRLRFVGIYAEPIRGMRRSNLVAGIFDISENRWEAMPVPIATERSSAAASLWMGLTVAGDTLLLPRRQNLFRWKWGSGKGDDIDLPVANAGWLQSVAGRIFATSSDSILELDESGSVLALLASRRRNPPSSPLDELRDLSGGTFIPAKNAGVRFFKNHILYEEFHGGWRELRRFPEVDRVEVFTHASILRDRPGKKTWILPHGSLEPVLLYDLVEPLGSSRFSIPGHRPIIPEATTVRSNLGKILGEIPAIVPADDRIYYFQEHLAERSAYEPDPERHASLVVSSLQGNGFQVIPIHFDERPLPGFSEPMRGIPGYRFDLLASDNWLIVLMGNRTWIISTSKIDELLEEAIPAE